MIELKPCPFCGHLPTVRKLTEQITEVCCENPATCFVRPCSYASDNKCAISAWNLRPSPNEKRELSPCSYSSKEECVNFSPRSDGAIERVTARTNAVVISYVEDFDDEGERYLRRFVWVECKDFGMKDELLLKAKEIMKALAQKPEVSDD